MSWILSRALMQAFVNSHSLPVQGAESLEANSSVGKQFALSNGKPTRQAYLFNGKTTGTLPRSLSGMTCKHLTEDLGAEVLTWFLAASRARISAAPEKVQALAVRVPDYGVRWRELSMKYNQNLCLWKTRPSLWDEGWTSSLGTLPRWGLMQDGVLWEHVMLARLTNETEYGSLPTPVKYDTGGRGEGDNYHGLGWQAKYTGTVSGPAGQYPKGYKPSEWPTPICSDSSVGKDLFTLQKVENGNAFNQLAREVRKRQHIDNGTFVPDPNAEGVNPQRRAKLWPTPVKNEDRAAAYTEETSFKHFQEGSHQVHLAQAVRDTRMFPTPTAGDQGRKPPVQLRRTRTGLLVSDTGTFRQLNLGSVVKAEAMQIDAAVQPSKQAQNGLWPTPMTTGLRGGSGVPKDLNQRLGLPTPTALNGLRSSSSSDHHPGKWQSPGHPEYGELNPDWVEWIMGWGIGWTSLNPMPAGNLKSWLELTSADESNEQQNLWWQADPSDAFENPLPKTTVPPTKKAELVRVHRIAALGNGQVSAVAAAAWTYLWNLDTSTIGE